MSDTEEPIVVEETPIEETEEVEEEVDFVGEESASEVKLFGKWSFEDIEIRDISMVVRLRNETL
jgi:small subunit ribosomal protein S5e